MKKYVFVGCILATCLTQNDVAEAQGRADIVQIYFNFLASRVAALGCDAVDKNTELNFLANEHVVLIRATQALQERNMNLSETELATKIKAAQNNTAATVKNEITEHGCSSARIKELLRMYDLHSKMHLH